MINRFSAVSSGDFEKELRGASSGSYLDAFFSDA